MDKQDDTPMEIYMTNKDDLDINTMLYYLLNKDGSVENIPEEFLTNEMFSEYIKRGGKLKNVPKRFVNQDLFNEYFYMNFNSKTFLLDMPEDIITENMIKFFIQNSKEKEWINYIPKIFITEEIKEQYFISLGRKEGFIRYLYDYYKKSGINNIEQILDYVPIKYISDVCADFIIKTGEYRHFPSKYLTEEVKEKVFASKGGVDNLIANILNSHYLISAQGDIVVDSNHMLKLVMPKDMIPEHYHKEICEKIFEKSHRVFDNLFDEYATKEMIIETVKTTSKIPQIVNKNPESHLDIYLYYYDLTKDVYNIPAEVRKKVIEMYIQKGDETAENNDINYLLDVFMSTKNVDLIPSELQEEVCKTYLFKTNSIDGVPERYLLSICTDYFTGDYYMRRRKKPNGYDIFLQNHFANTLSLEEIPYVFGHRSISVNAYYEQIGGPENIPEDKKEELFKYIFNRTFDLNLIPKKYVTKEMVDNYIEQGFFKQIDNIPTQFLTVEICKKYLYHTNKISGIPQSFLRKHPDIYIYYLNINHNVRTIPKHFLTEDICIEFVKTQRRLPKADEEFLLEHPNIYIEYFNATNDIKSIPTFLITDDLIEQYIKAGGNLTNIEKKYLDRHQNLYLESFNATHDLKGVPENLITLEMCIDYLEKLIETKKAYDKQILERKIFHRYDEVISFDGYDVGLNLIPERYKEQTYELFVQKTERLDLIPNSYKTEKMCLEYLKKTFDIRQIPNELLNQEMCDLYFEKYCLENNKNLLDNFTAIPVRFITGYMIDELVEISGVSLKELPDNIKTSIVKYELINMKPGTKKYQVVNKLGLGENIVDRALKELKEQNPEEYEKVQKIFKGNSVAEYAVLLKKVKTLEEIIDSLGTIRKKLTKQQQIKFAYLVVKEDLYFSLEGIQKRLESQQYLSPKVFMFFKRHLGLEARQMKEEFGNKVLTEKDRYAAKCGANWLRYFSLDKKFKVTNGHMTTISYLGKDGNHVELDKETAREIINILVENDIQPINCIVNAALSMYCIGDLDDFIERLKSYEIHKEENKNNIRKR